MHAYFEHAEENSCLKAPTGLASIVIQRTVSKHLISFSEQSGLFPTSDNFRNLHVDRTQRYTYAASCRAVPKRRNDVQASKLAFEL